MSYITIRGSVGINGNNHYQDILAIQKALNQRLSLISPTAKLAEDGSLGINPKSVR
jgi:hypothetical protein